MQLNNLQDTEILRIIEVLQLTSDNELSSKIFSQFNAQVNCENDFSGSLEDWRVMDLS